MANEMRVIDVTLILPDFFLGDRVSDSGELAGDSRASRLMLEVCLLARRLLGIDWDICSAIYYLQT